jgi:transcription initiation factor TFIIIB Brf1 subunit/transcription initiation factor TFIIB
VEEAAFLILQHALKGEGRLLQGRALGQLLLCSLYAAVRVADLPVKFGELLASYRNVLGLSVSHY